ncbi:MAG: IPTL-CTERM sorting domain-containing protein [Betaproteobacteria bacterium]|nr:MAG: IPTL-CTERM sorting domain-containing protein [Betaproteobacteria bacterium]
MRILFAVLLALGAYAHSAEAAVALRMVAGTTCSGAPSTTAQTSTSGGTVTFSLCADTTPTGMAAANDRICAVGFPVVTTNAATTAAGIRVSARTGVTLTNVTDLTTFSATAPILSATLTDFGLSVAPTGTAAGPSGANQRIAQLDLIVPANLAASSTLNFELAPTANVLVGDTAATDCNNLDATNTTRPAGTVAFAITVPAAANANLRWSTTPSVTVTENAAASNNVSVSCTGTLNNPVTVTPTLGALNAGNYTITPASLVFNTCAAQTFTVSPRANNATFDAAVTGGVTYGLSSNVGVTTAPPATVVTVNDDEVAPVFTVSKLTASVSEGAAPTNDTFNVVCTGAMPTGVSPITVSVTQTAGTASAMAGVDYTLTGSPASFTACAGATQAINLTPRANNGTNDGSKTATLTLGTPSAGSLGTNRAVALTIADDDGPFTVSVVANPGCAEPATNCSFSVTRSGGNVANALTVPINIGGTAARDASTTAGDYYIGAAACGSVGTASGDVSVTFAANEVNSVVKTINVCTVNNVVLNASVRSVTALVAAPGTRTDYTQSSATAAQVTIADDEVTVNAIAGATGTATSGSVPEGAVASFSVSCPAGDAIALNYSITPALVGLDSFLTGSANGVVNCTGSLNANLPVATIQTDNDTTIGNNRSYTMTLTPDTAGKIGVLATVIGNASATVNVLDDDQPKSIPTMGAFGLGLMSLLLVGIAGFVQRRRTK